MKILVTGAAGWVATWLIRDLLRGGHEVVGVDCNKMAQERSDFVGGEFKFVEDGFAHFLLKSKVSDWDFDVIVPLTGQLGSVESIESPVSSLADGVQTNLLLLQDLSTVGKKPLIVFVSSDLCYREPSRCLYSLHKKTVEGYLRIFHNVYGIPYSVLRMGTGYGPLQKRDSVVNFYIRRALGGETIPVYGSGDNRQAFVFIDDAVECIRLACEGVITQNCVLPLVGQNLRIVELAEAVSEVVGGEVEHVGWPELAWKVNVGDLPIELLPPKGWFPKVKIHEGIERTAEWMRAQK